MDSYNEILTKMEDAYEDTAGFVPDKYSDTGVRLRVLAGEIFNLKSEMEWFKNQMFPASASGVFLDYHAAERGLSRKPSAKATGIVTFAKEYADQTVTPVPLGTVVSTDSETPLRFVTIEDAYVPPGTTYVRVAVEAEKGGSEYNVDKEEICVAATTIPRIIQVINLTPMSGGADEESDEDFRTRLLDTYKNRNNGTNISYYRELALSIDGVYSVGVIPKNRGTGTVDVFINKSGGQYADNELISRVQTLMTKQREVNVDVKVQSASGVGMSAYLLIGIEDGYDFSVVKKQCVAAITSYINSIGVGGTFYLSEVGERVYHIEGVRNYNFDDDYCRDMSFGKSRFPICTEVTVEEIK
ncbi:MAG: baseplate J/gp47 family protein [Ruminococcus sp.]|nr:baseplate J/gp47 family protein [Ruminococcus sp.]